jgi:hypothetical protein
VSILPCFPQTPLTTQSGAERASSGSSHKSFCTARPPVFSCLSAGKTDIGSIESWFKVVIRGEERWEK